MQVRFHVGDKAYYPVHGIAEVVALEKRAMGAPGAVAGSAAQTTSVYVLRIVDSGLKIMIPTSKADAVGLRPIIAAADVAEVYDTLRSRDVIADHQTWNRRHREYMDKIRTGSAQEIAEVLRDLLLLRRHKELSFGERRMLETARGLLVREIALAMGQPEAEIQAEIETIFQDKAA